jgi:hypothetical protein
MNRTALAMILLVLIGVTTSLAALDALAAPRLLPGVLSVFPPAGSHANPANTSVSITYDEAIDSDTVNADTYLIYSMEHGYVAGNYSVNGGEIVFTPAAPFAGGSLVESVATTMTLNLGGQGPLEATVWRFRIDTSSSSGVLQNTGQLLGDTRSLDVALGDLDGDGDLDAFVANNGPDYVWMNDGNSNFTDSGQRLPPEGLFSVEVDLGDLDKDGDLDAFVVVYSADTWGRVWWNNGAGIFTDSGQNIGGDQGSAVALGDLDGDGDLDAVFARRTNARVYLNDGQGIFTSSGQTNIYLLSGTDVALDDLDEDGDLDAFFTNNTGDLTGYQQVYLNDNGLGHFTNSGQDIGRMPANGVSLGDIDGDGDLDAMLAIIKPSGFPSAPNEVWLNNGSGYFTDSGARLGLDSTNQAVLGDMDGDGDLDAFFANLQLPNELWANDGAGNFIQTRQFLTRQTSPSVELGDLDEDGDLDIFLTKFLEPENVWRNLDEVFFMQLPLLPKH